MSVGRALGLVIVVLAAGPGTEVSAKPRIPDNDVELSQAWARFQTRGAKQEPALEFPYEHCFRRAAATHGLPLTLLLAVARGESDFDPRARSHANALGLMQILWPSTAKHLGLDRLTDLYRPCTNVDAGARYLRELLTRYDGDLHLALAAYNYGPGRVPKNGDAIPQGATWYSGYIYRHLRYVLGASQGAEGKARYRDERKLPLLVFGTPYRARAFVATLQRAAPALRLDWFRSEVGRFQVVMLYQGEDDLARSKQLLARAGFPLR